MGTKRAYVVLLLLALVVMNYGVTKATGLNNVKREYEEQEEDEMEWKGEGKDLFLLQNKKHVIKTDAGGMKLVKSFGGGIIDKPMHIGFITMEPKSLFVPQYLDSSLILFVRQGTIIGGLVAVLFCYVLQFLHSLFKLKLPASR